MRVTGKVWAADVRTSKHTHQVQHRLSTVVHVACMCWLLCQDLSMPFHGEVYSVPS